MSKLTDAEFGRKVREREQRYAAGIKLTLHKAKLAGITATPGEIDQYMKDGTLPKVEPVKVIKK